MIIADASIWHSSTAKNTSILQPVINIYPASPSQISASQVDILHHSFFQLSSGQVGISQIDISENGLGEVSSFEPDSPQYGSTQVRFSDFSTYNQTISQVSLNQGAIQDRTTQISATQVSTVQTPISLKEGTSKVSFASAVFSEQLLSSSDVVLHDWLLAPVNSALKSTAFSLWQSFYPNFDLTLEVTDLLTGQLAAAQVTQVNTQGVTTGSTLYLDTDSNGLGWYIAPTP